METVINNANLVAPILAARSAYSFGTLLPAGATGKVNAGIGPVLIAEAASFLAPTHVFDDTLDIVLAGVRFEFRYAPSEADDEIVMWLPELGVAAVGGSDPGRVSRERAYAARHALSRSGALVSNDRHDARLPCNAHGAGAWPAGVGRSGGGGGIVRVSRRHPVHPRPGDPPYESRPDAGRTRRRHSRRCRHIWQSTRGSASTTARSSIRCGRSTPDNSVGSTAIPLRSIRCRVESARVARST